MVLDDGTITIPGIGTDGHAYVQRWDGKAWSLITVDSTLKVKAYEPLEFQEVGGTRLDLFYLTDPDAAMVHSWSTDTGKSWAPFEKLGGAWAAIGGGTSINALVAAVAAALPPAAPSAVDLSEVLQAAKAAQAAAQGAQAALAGIEADVAEIKSHTAHLV